MAKVGFGTVSKRAFREARAEVRLDSFVRIFIATISPLVVSAMVWWATRNVAWTGIGGVGILVVVFAVVFLVNLIKVPLDIANEATAEIAEQNEKNTQDVKALNQKIELLTRDPDGIYQYNQHVATVENHRVELGQSSAFFERIISTGKFDSKAEFEFREWRMKLISHGIVGSVTGLGGNFYRFNEAKALLVRLREEEP